jgi:hypothetical protein
VTIDLGICACLAPHTALRAVATFKDYPPSQRPASFTIDQIIEKMQQNFEASHTR